MQCLLDVKAVDDLNHAGKKVPASIFQIQGAPSAITTGFVCASAQASKVLRRLPQLAIGEGESLLGGIRRDSALDSRRIGDRTLVEHRQTLR